MRGCSPARQRRAALTRRRDGVPVGTAQSRESLTQDSRSAVKARLFDPLRESFGEERCTPGTADESFTQPDGAPLRRDSSIRYANHSATGFAPIALEDVMAFRRPSRGSEPSVMRRDALESRADRGMRAYVTSGLVPTRAKRRACATASRHTVWASSRLATHGRREDLRVARTAWWRRSPGRAQGDGGRRLRSLQASPPKVATVRVAGTRRPRSC